MRLIPRTRGGSLWRFAAGAVIVIGFTAATTAVAGLLQVKNIVDALNLTAPLSNARVQLPAPGAPQTILLIGSDHRVPEPYRIANTDTMMLVRINDSSQTLNVLSIPRDLKVQLPDGTAKLNAAYSEGGPNVLIKTLQKQVFPGLIVNHVLDVNFSGFEDLVNAIGCVDADVDHRYYNVSEPGPNNYSSIDIQPGYQKLCGANALAFVRFRHTDSDIVRSARQQDFLRWAKGGYSGGRLFANRNPLLKIFGHHVQTDKSLHTTDGIIELLDLVVNADRLAVKQVKFPYSYQNCATAPATTTGGFVSSGCADYVVPTSSAAEHRAYVQLMTPTQATTASVHKRHKRTKLSTAGLISDVPDGHSQAAGVGHLPFPVYYPKLEYAGFATQYCLSITANCDDGGEPQTDYTGSYPRAYHINGGGHRYSAYRMTVAINPALGEYYGIQGMNWLHPPILNKPSSTRTVARKKLMLYANGSHLSMVAWRTATSSYWVSNSLDDKLTNSQMLEIAASLTRAQ